MKHTRTILSWVILVVALVVMTIPLPGKDDSHLLSEAEASDATLVILTTGDTTLLNMMVDQFVAETNVNVRIESVAAADLTSQQIKKSHADIVLVNEIASLVPLIQNEALDTLPLDILWNVDETFRDPAERWVGFTGRLHNGELSLSALALAQTSDSKPLAERFIIYTYSRQMQEMVVNTTGEYSFLAFGVPTPAGLPELTSLDVQHFGAIYDSAALSAGQSNDLASTR